MSQISTLAPTQKAMPKPAPAKAAAPGTAAAVRPGVKSPAAASSPGTPPSAIVAISPEGMSKAGGAAGTSTGAVS